MRKKGGNIGFINKLFKASVKWIPAVYGPKTGGINSRYPEFTNKKISNVDFDRLLKILNDEKLFIMPNLSISGSIDGFRIYKLDKLSRPIVIFRELNMPKEKSLKDIFENYVMSKKNLAIYNQLISQDLVPIIRNYEDYI